MAEELPAMAEENVEIVRDVYERWRAGDFRAGADVFDPLVLFVMQPEFPDAGTYLGLDQLAEYTRGFLEPWSRITIEAEELISAGDSVVAPVCQRGVGEEAARPPSSDTSTCGRSGAKG